MISPTEQSPGTRGEDSGQNKWETGAPTQPAWYNTNMDKRSNSVPTNPKSEVAPLAARMRPRTLDEILGQEHVLGPGRSLRKAIEADRVPSLILWGPPGSGKTTLARVIANITQSHFAPVSAVSAGVADLRRIVKEAQDRLSADGQRTILFIDEIHRFNKSQQ